MTAGTTALGLGAVTGLGAGAGAAAGWMEPIPVEQMKWAAGWQRVEAERWGGQSIKASRAGMEVRCE